MASYLLPRLDRLAVDTALEMPEELLGHVLARLSPETAPGGMHYAASGGSRVDNDRLLQLRSELLAVAERFGFPNRSSTKQRAAFDAGATALLACHPLFQGGEALRDDVWAFVSTVLVPDLVTWRFPNEAASHFHGGIRNAFQRLWLRGRILDRGESSSDRWGLVEALSEDALVQITERPAIAADTRLARAFAEGWVRALDRYGRSAIEDATRAAVIRLRLRNQVQLLSILQDEALAVAMDDIFGAPEQAQDDIRAGWVRRVFGR